MHLLTHRHVTSVPTWLGSQSNHRCPLQYSRYYSLFCLSFFCEESLWRACALPEHPFAFKVNKLLISIVSGRYQTGAPKKKMMSFNVLCQMNSQSRFTLTCALLHKTRGWRTSNKTAIYVSLTTRWQISILEWFKWLSQWTHNRSSDGMMVKTRDVGQIIIYK